MSSVTRTLATVGLSPKAIAAFVWPVVVAGAAAIASWVVSGEFNANEIRTALAGVITGGVSFVGAYLAEPGDVEVE